MVTGYYYFAGRIRSTDSFTYRQFVDALNQSKVEEVLLKPNASGTAGKVIIEMKEGDTYQLYVTDIAQVDTLLRESYGNVNVVVDDIPQDKSFINSALMILATAAIFIFFFAMINRQNGGTNAQMMNFGKSRARMSSPSDTEAGSGGNCRFPQRPCKIHCSRSTHPERCPACRTSRNGQDPDRKSCCGRGRCSVLLNFRLGFCRDVRRCRRIPCP